MCLRLKYGNNLEKHKEVVELAAELTDEALTTIRSKVADFKVYSAFAKEFFRAQSSRATSFPS